MGAMQSMRSGEQEQQKWHPRRVFTGISNEFLEFVRDESQSLSLGTLPK